MSKFTNKHGLPPLLARVLERDEYRLDADYSATGLINPPQQQVLIARHADRIVSDVSDNIWAVLGSSVHYILEKTAGSDLMRERRFVVRFGGISVQMTPDLYQLSTGHLWDYKVTSVWSTIRGVKPEWEAQTNIYQFGLDFHGHPVNHANILAILRDWSLPKARIEGYRGNKDYPPVQIKVMPVKLWSMDKVNDYVVERIALHEDAKLCTDQELFEKYPCSHEERWAKVTTYPVIRKGRAAPGTAKLESREEAEEWMAIKGKPGDEITKRWGEQTRCELYCSAAPFCKQFKDIKGD